MSINSTTTFNNNSKAAFTSAIQVRVIGHWTCDSQVTGSAPAWAPLCSGLEQASASRDAESLFFLVVLRFPTPGLENLGLQTPTMALKSLDSDSGPKIKTPTPTLGLIV